MNPYQEMVSEYVRLVHKGKRMPLGGFAPAPRPIPPSSAPTVLFFAPHPDDETIVGGLALRLLREAHMKVYNVAVTFGSKQERQAARLTELRNACDFLGFDLITTGPTGLEKINAGTREKDEKHWSACVAVIRGILESHLPRVILFPHEQDWNSTHIGTHYLIMDALRQMPASFECFMVETEFWGQMHDPNLLVEIGEQALADMIAATSFHVGEVERNPYHVLLPAWMMDNVRRGSELVGGQGQAAPNFTFAVLQRLRKWRQGNVEKLYVGGQQIAQTTNLGQLFS